MDRRVNTHAYINTRVHERSNSKQSSARDGRRDVRQTRLLSRKNGWNADSRKEFNAQTSAPCDANAGLGGAILVNLKHLLGLLAALSSTNHPVTFECTVSPLCVPQFAGDMISLIYQRAPGM